MASHDYIRYIPTWKRPQELTEDDSGRLQINPSSAIASSASRARLSNIMTALTMVMVLAVVFVGTRMYQDRSQRVDVAASVDMNKSLRGLVAGVDYQGNSFSLVYEDSMDPEILAFDHAKWNVQLPPGTKFLGKQSFPIRTCFKVPDLNSTLSYAEAIPCAHIVVPGKKVIVEYVQINGDTQSLIAQTIIGEIK
jgi:hypothetical protein